MKKLLFLAVLIAAFLLNGCYGAAYHFQKFEQKGGKIEPVTIKDSIPYVLKGIDGKDSIVYKIVLKDCPEVTTPKTNTEIRQDARTERTEIKQQGKTDRNDSDNALKLELAQMKFELKIKQEENDSLKIVNKTIQKEIKQDGKLAISELKGVPQWKVTLLCIGVGIICFVLGYLLSVIIGAFKKLPLINR